MHLDLTETNVEGNRRLKHKLEMICNKAGIYAQLVDRGLYLGQNTPIGRHRAPVGYTPFWRRSAHERARP